jgi:hypothetical protein
MGEEGVVSFADLVARQGRPSVAETPGEYDLPSPSLFKSQQQALLGNDVKEGKPAIELAVTSFSEVFVLWRPWETCGRCKDAINDELNEIELPEVGDYTCPHVQKAEFKEVRDKCLRGDGLLSNEEFFNLKNGTRCVHIAWLEPDQAELKKLEKLKKIQQKNRDIYPHDPSKKED